MNLSMAQLAEDVRTNRGNVKGQLIVVLFRIAHAARQPQDRRPRLLALPIGILYRFVVEWVLGVEIPWGTRIGRRFKVLHGVGIVINPATVIGDDVVIRNNVTLGNKGRGQRCPVVEDGVVFGASCVVIGGVRVGRGARVAPGAVVNRDVPAWSVAAGNPARAVPPSDLPRVS